MEDWYNSFEYHSHVAERLNALGISPYAREAYEFALEAYQFEPNYHEDFPAPPKHIALTYNISAHNYAYCYLLHAKEVFEDPAAILGSWGIHTSKDIGEVIYGLVKVGLIAENPGDAKEQFEGLFKIEDVL